MNFKKLDTEDEVRDLIRHLNFMEFVVLDVETTSVDPRKAELIDIQLSGHGGVDAVIFDGKYAPLLLELSPKLTLVGQSYKYDAHVLFRHGVDLLDRTWRDTIILQHLLEEDRISYSLDAYVKEHFNDSYKEDFWALYSSYQEAPEETRTTYACKDIYYTSHCYTSLNRRCEGDGIPRSLIGAAHRLQRSLLRTEIAGLRVDVDYLGSLGVQLKHRLDELEPEMRSLVKDEIEILELEAWEKEIEKRKTPRGKAGVQRPSFSFASTQQLCSLLFRSLGLPEQRNEKTKAVSTDYASLENLRGSHPIIERIQENRELTKIYGTYVVGTIDRLDGDRIYPSFRVNGTATGRLSHSNPNLAQLPKQGGVRGIYTPDAGMVLVSADYSQLEVVVEANLTGCPVLAQMIANGESKHDVTSRELGIDRNLAKTVNFCLQYWGSHFKIAKILDISVPEALKVWNKYWSVYSGSRALKAETDRAVNEGIPLVTLFGRKRRFEHKKRRAWDGDYRQAYNFMIQGTGADLTSRAFVETDEWLIKLDYGKGLFTVHDEIMAQSRPEFAEETQDGMIKKMTDQGDLVGFKIPLKAEGSGPMDRWED